MTKLDPNIIDKAIKALHTRLADDRVTYSCFAIRDAFGWPEDYQAKQNALGYVRAYARFTAERFGCELEDRPEWSESDDILQGPTAPIWWAINGLFFEERLEALTLFKEAIERGEY